MSGRCTCVVAFRHTKTLLTTEHIIGLACARLALPHRGSEQLLHGTGEIPARTNVEDWPGVVPLGEITEYQLILL
eukprot:5160940-Amphidinium_carterae.1